MTTPDELRTFEVFAGLPDDLLQWIIDHGEVLDLAKGEQAVRDGAEAREMFVVLSGALEFRYTLGGQLMTSGRQEPGVVTGLLPYSRMTHYRGISMAVEPTRVLRIGQEHFADMLHRSMELGRRLVAIMSDRVRTSTKNAQQREKLMALGKLSAGLAHELNNPAAAVRRTAEALRERLDGLGAAAARLADLGVTEAQLCAVDGFREQVQARDPVSLSTMARSEREDELADWLDDHGVDDGWMRAETFADAGMTPADLEDLAAEVPAAALPGVVAWFEGGLAADRLLGEIEDASARISELVASVKGYTHMDQNPNKQPVDVRVGINSTLTMLRHKLRTKNVDVECDFPADVPEIAGYPGELNQVWTNLIDNAADAVPDDGGQIRIEVMPRSTYLCIRVIDNGHGIPADVQSRIFEPFFTTKDVGQGTGLGLDVVQRIVREHHSGDITVASQPGRTVFEVRLPLEG